VLRERMETLLDVPLHEVRVFRDSVAQQVTHAHGADAVTVENAVHLSPGQGEPSAPSGQALLAHELSHVAARQAGSIEPSELEERRAQSIEYAVKAQPEQQQLPARPAPAPRLDHRVSALHTAPSASPLAGMAQAASYSGGFARGGFAGSGTAGSAGGGGSGAAALAPLDRVPAPMDQTMMAGALGAGAAADAAGTTELGAEAEERDEAGTIDRVVEAVLRRLRREGSLERERRGSFRSEIGG
jgi:hypothetical protein